MTADAMARRAGLDSATGQDPAELYLELLKRALTRSLDTDRYRNLEGLLGPRKRRALRVVQRALFRFGLVLAGSPAPEDSAGDGPELATQGETMIGRNRLDNLHMCIREAIRRGVPGDLIETGVWRGGATIFMRGALKAYRQLHRKVWVADSFAGLPRPNSEKYPADAQNGFWTHELFAVSKEAVERNFERYGLLDHQVAFLHGWFRDTLPTAPIERLAVLRLDGDMYESTIDALSSLYPKLSPGGYVIVDDYGAVPECRKAVDDYRAEHGITERIETVRDWQNSCVYWLRER
jgi:O-methyltransferase